MELEKASSFSRGRHAQPQKTVRGRNTRLLLRTSELGKKRKRETAFVGDFIQVQDKMEQYTTSLETRLHMIKADTDGVSLKKEVKKQR